MDFKKDNIEQKKKHITENIQYEGIYVNFKTHTMPCITCG